MISVTQATPNQIPFIQPENPFPRPGLQQQAGEIENAVLGFCKTTFDNLRHLGSTAISFVMKCKEELGEEEGKSVFDNWLESDGFGPSKYVLRVAMKIATRYSDLKPRLQKIARDNVQLWGLRALDDLFSVSESFFEMMIKRGRKAHKAIKNADNALQGKLPSLSRGSFVQVAASEDHQVKGSLGTIIDKDEHGNIVVRLVESGAEVMLRHQNLSKKPLKAVNESLLEIVENLREESLQKEQRLSEYQSAATSSSIGEVLFQEERQENAAEPIAKYEQNKVQNNTAIQDKIKVAALADSSVENEALLQTIEKLRQQVEEKERLEQVIEDLRHQIEEQKLATLRSQQLEEHNQKLQQQVVDLQQALTTTSSTLLPDINNQEISIPDNTEVEAKHDAQLEKIEERRQELNEYKAAFDAFVGY